MKAGANAKINTKGGCFMNKTTKTLTDWAINKIKTEYAQDIALLVAIEGHSVNNDGHGECFDYFVPATERGNELSMTFIINGIGHDLYPRSWERTERTANLEDRATFCIGDAKILYSRSKEDEDRFHDIQKKLHENLKNKEFVYKKALEGLNVAMDLYRTIMFEDELYKVRMAAGYINNYLSVAVVYLNGGYKTRLMDLESIGNLPVNFIEYYKAIIHAGSVSELKSLTHMIINTTRQFIALHKPTRTALERKPDFRNLADWYQEGSVTWRRIEYYCERNNVQGAFEDACFLQNELTIVEEEFGLKRMDLLSSFDGKNLEGLIQRGKELEQDIIAEIESHGVKLKSYDTLEAFLLEN